MMFEWIASPEAWIALGVLLALVFSLDSIITAVGLVQHVSIMVIAIVISVLVMMFSAEPIGRFVDNNPTIKMLALSFLLLIGGFNSEVHNSPALGKEISHL